MTPEQMKYQQLAGQIALQQGVDPRVFTSQIQQESQFNPTAVSRSGAQGIAQLMPKFHPGVDAGNPQEALDYAANWMHQLHDQYGNYPQALSVYNSGRPNAYQNPHFAHGQTYDYVKKIMGNHQDGTPQAFLGPVFNQSPVMNPSIGYGDAYAQ